MTTRAVASETRRVVCSICGEGPVSGGPGYLVKRGDQYVHGDVRTCAYVVSRRLEERKQRGALVRLWLAIRDLFGK